jgi:hypothetical protein
MKTIMEIFAYYNLKKTGLDQDVYTYDGPEITLETTTEINKAYGCFGDWTCPTFCTATHKESGEKYEFGIVGDHFVDSDFKVTCAKQVFHRMESLGKVKEAPRGGRGNRGK